MSDKEKSLQETAWEKVLNEITDPWDWIAAGAGAAIGGVVAFITHWPDLFTIVATGATAGVTIRKAWGGGAAAPTIAQTFTSVRQTIRADSISVRPGPTVSGA